MKHLGKFIIGAIIVTATTVGVSAFAARGDGDHRDKMVERISGKLDLTDTQDAALQTFADEMAQMRILIRGNGTDLRTEMSSLIETDTFDQGMALTLINERVAAVQSNAPELVAAAAVFFDGLSSEQKAQVQELSEKRGHGRGRHKGEGKD